MVYSNPLCLDFVEIYQKNGVQTKVHVKISLQLVYILVKKFVKPAGIFFPKLGGNGDTLRQICCMKRGIFFLLQTILVLCKKSLQKEMLSGKIQIVR